MSRLVRPDIKTKGLFGFSASPVDVTPDMPGAPKTDGGSLVAVDNYTTRMIKYVPAEVIAFYLAADKLFERQEGTTTTAAAGDAGTTDYVTHIVSEHSWAFSAAVFVIAALGVPLYYRSASDQGQPWAVNVFMALIAFVVWSYAAQGSIYFYKTTVFYNAQLASFLILVFTFLAGFVVPGVGSAASNQVGVVAHDQNIAPVAPVAGQG